VKVTMEYTLPEEAHEYRCAREGADLRSAMCDFAEWLRRQFKYENTPPTLDQIRTHFHEVLEERSINLWEDA
jgi:hypothetical protein